MERVKVAIIGSGNIGTDLLIKILRSPYLECTVFIGRNLFSSGMMKAQSLGVPVSAEGIGYLEKHPECCDLVFDATSAASHEVHAPILSKLGKMVIDMTPSSIGEMCVPVINMKELISQKNIQNVNMVTCGGQASLPIAYALALTQENIDYIEVISSIASRSAGPATRVNLDEYIHTTEHALRTFSHAKQVKAILNLNPAQPCINMQTTVFAKVPNLNLDALKTKVNDIVEKVKSYVPGYQMIVQPMVENDRVVMMVRTKGLGDYLPEYAGNLDIINCAALATAETYATHIKNKETMSYVNDFNQ